MADFISDADKEGAANKGITSPYQVYGNTDNSTINIKLTKELVAGEPGLEQSPHDTAAVGTPAEKYTLAVLYTPDYTVVPPSQSPQGQADPETFHTGSFSLKYQGHAAGTETSTNEHVINVFKKSLQITKTNEDFNTNLKGAEFKVYRTAREGESSVTLPGVEGNYYEAKTLDMSSTESILAFDLVEKLNTGEKCYLVETKAPDGYNTLENPIEVQLEITDWYAPVPPGNEWSTSDEPESDSLYNWSEKAIARLVGGAGVKEVDEDGNDKASTQDSETATIYYDIANNSGVELPMTGGQGTMAFTLLGVMLIAIGSAALVNRRRTHVVQVQTTATTRCREHERGGRRQ